MVLLMKKIIEYISMIKMETYDIMSPMIKHLSKDGDNIHLDIDMEESPKKICLLGLE